MEVPSQVLGCRFWISLGLSGHLHDATPGPASQARPSQARCKGGYGVPSDGMVNMKGDYQHSLYHSLHYTTLLLFLTSGV